jgi:FkbM family methyltransferase
MNVTDYKWCGVSVEYTDGKQLVADPLGNAMVIFPDKTCQLIEGGFPNPLGLKFTRPDGIEYLIMHEFSQGGYDGLGLNESSRVVDIGAHVGVISMLLAKAYGCRVIAYEPAPGNYSRLLSNIRKNKLSKLILPLNAAVTRDGRDVFIDGDMSRNSGSMMIYHAGQGTRVASVTLADIICNHTVDLLKIDCEGAEHEILDDFTPLVHVKAIRGEFHDLDGDNIHFRAEELLTRVRTIVPNTQVTT